jgi:hypothetical protein
VVEKINALFAIDAEAREQGLNLEARQALPCEQAPAVLEAIKAAVEAARASALPGSTFCLLGGRVSVLTLIFPLRVKMPFSSRLAYVLL